MLKMVCIVATKLEKYFNRTKTENYFTDLYAEDDNQDHDEFEVIEVAPNRFKTTFHVPQ